MKFIPTNEWMRVPDDAVLPPGCEIRMDMTKGITMARLMQSKQPPRVELKDEEIAGAGWFLVGMFAVALLGWSLWRAFA